MGQAVEYGFTYAKNWLGFADLFKIESNKKWGIYRAADLLL